MSLSPADPAESDLYADNPAWADLTPIQQDVGDNPMAPIFYETEWRLTSIPRATSVATFDRLVALVASSHCFPVCIHR